MVPYKHLHSRVHTQSLLTTSQCVSGTAEKQMRRDTDTQPRSRGPRLVPDLSRADSYLCLKWKGVSHASVSSKQPHRRVILFMTLLVMPNHCTPHTLNRTRQLVNWPYQGGAINCMHMSVLHRHRHRHQTHLWPLLHCRSTSASPVASASAGCAWSQCSLMHRLRPFS